MVGLPRFSILLPTHDRADVLGHAIRSVLDQSMPDFELLVVGDGCGADTRSVVAGFEDPRIRFFDLPKAPHFGYANRNVALREARGALIAFAADDDLLFPDHLERLEHALSGGAALAYSQALWVSTDGIAAPLLTNLELADELRSFMERHNSIPASCFAYRADSVPSPDGWPEDIAAAADWRLWQGIMRGNPDHPVVYCRVPTVLHFSARWKNSRHSSIGELATLLEIADSVDWWPAALRIVPQQDTPAQSAFAGLMQADPQGWSARTRQGAADLIARLAWDDIRSVRPALKAADERVASLRADLAARVAEVATCKAEIAAALADRDRRGAEVAALRASTSWRMTGPLRAAIIGARRLVGRS